MRKLSVEEINGKVQGFPEAYELMFGEKLELGNIIYHLEQTLHAMREKRIREAFDNLHPESIKGLIKALQETKDAQSMVEQEVEIKVQEEPSKQKKSKSKIFSFDLG